MIAIIPCAGLGTRMNMKLDESKEMLLDPYYGNKPVIQWTLDLCARNGIQPLIVTRKEKTDLIDYVKAQVAKTMVIEPDGEWMDTVYVAAHANRYEDTSVLLLPDTRFSPADQVMRGMKADLALGAKISIAVHNVEDVSQWCEVKEYTLIEKPKVQACGEAFGLIAWRGAYILDIMENLSKNKWHRLQDTSFQYLNDFKDITRTGVIEPY